MYVIMKWESDEFYAEYTCGCVVWKRHVSRAALFECVSDALHDAYDVAGMSEDEFIIVGLNDMEQ